MTPFLDKKLSSLQPYTPGEQPRDMDRLIKLNTNECPFPPSPRVVEAISAAEVEKLRLYSDPTCKALVEAVAAYNGVKPTQVCPGNGSDEVLAFLFHGFCQAGAVFPDITYGFYQVFAQMFGVAARQIPLREDFSIAVEDYVNCKETVFLANPNAPTGLFLPLLEIEKLLKQNRNRLVVVDEAYVEFGGDTAAALLPDYDNLVVVRTFSKSHALAGARLGYALASEEIIRALNTLRFSFNPYNINRLSLLAGTAAMEDRAWFERCRGEIMESRAYTTAGLRAMGFTVPESRANFLFAGRHPKLSGADYFRGLREQGILVRYFDAPRTADFVRITIGARAQMERLLEVTEALLAQKGERKA